MILMNLLILFGIGRKSLSSRKSRSASLSNKKGDSQGEVIIKAFSLSTTYKILSNILFSSLISYTDDNCVDIAITDQLLIIYCAFNKYLRKNEKGISNKSL